MKDQAIPCSDETLLTGYFSGDLSAFTELYERHRGGVFRYILRQLHDNQLAEDLVQDVWGKVISHGKEFNPEAKFSTWLYTIARNRIIDHVRHHNVAVRAGKDANYSPESGQQEFSNDENDRVLNPENKIAMAQQIAAMKSCLQVIPKLQLECFLLKEEGNLTIADISEVVSISFEAAKSRMRYAYRNLRQCITNKIGSLNP